MPTSPLSPTLKQLREALGGINSELFELLQRRRDVVDQIQSLKPMAPAGWASFDAQREADFFQSMHDELMALSMKELLAFSLIMESHAGSPARYPAWSEGVHLLEIPAQDFHRINPLLLKEVHPEVVKGLRLRPSFGFLYDS